MKKYITSILLAVSFTLAASEPVKMAVITDLHYLSPKLAPDREARELFLRHTGRNSADLYEVLDTVLNRIRIEETDILLIAGDMTHHGEKESHLDLVEKLKRVQASGTKVFVIPGNHDVNIPDSKSYTKGKTTPVESISKTEFAQLYAPFGYNDALAKDDASLSYLAEISPAIRLLCIDTNRYDEHTTTSISGGRILPPTLDWALEILRQAKEQNVKVLVMMHHGLVEHLPYQSVFFANYLIDDWQERAEILADAGVKVVFTGHFHANDITSFTSPSGNTLYDVETASLAQYPFAYRLAELNRDSLSINTHLITSIAGNPGFPQQARMQLEATTRRVAENRLKHLAIPIPDDTSGALADLIVRMNMLHVAGDEVVDEAILQAVKNLADLLGSDEADSSFRLDFPPADNRLTIKLND